MNKIDMIDQLIDSLLTHSYFFRRFNTRVRPKKQYEVPVQELGCDLLSESGSSEEENLEITPCVSSEANESLLLKVLYSS